MKKFLWVLGIFIVVLIGVGASGYYEIVNIKKRVSTHENQLQKLAALHFHEGNYFQKGKLYFVVTAIIDHWIVTCQAGTINSTNYSWDALDLIMSDNFKIIKDQSIIDKLLARARAQRECLGNKDCALNDP